EVDDLGRLVVDAVAGAVGGAVSGDAGVREVEVRRVGAEDLRGARHQVAHLSECFAGVAEADLTEATAEVSVHGVDLVAGLSLTFESDARADFQAVVEGRVP